MRTRKIIIFSAALALLLLLAFSLWPISNQPFSKYIHSPVPKSVHVVSFQSQDWFGANPEPVCYLAFTASVEDLAAVIQQAGFRPASTNRSVPVPSGPIGWLTADQVGPSGRVYTRSHPSRPGRRLPLGRNRSWTEFLWIDGTGTNAYFLLWGI